MEAEQVRYQLVQMEDTIRAINWWFSDRRDRDDPNDNKLGCLIQRHAYCLVLGKSPKDIEGVIPTDMTDLKGELERKVKSLKFIAELDDHLIMDKEK